MAAICTSVSTEKEPRGEMSVCEEDQTGSEVETWFSADQEASGEVALCAEEESRGETSASKEGHESSGTPVSSEEGACAPACDSEQDETRPTISKGALPTRRELMCAFVVVTQQSYLIAFGKSNKVLVAAEETHQVARKSRTAGRKQAAAVDRSRRLCAKQVAQRVQEVLVDESGTPRSLGIVLGGRGPMKRLLQDQLSPELSRIVIR